MQATLCHRVATRSCSHLRRQQAELTPCRSSRLQAHLAGAEFHPPALPPSLYPSSRPGEVSQWESIPWHAEGPHVGRTQSGSLPVPAGPAPPIQCPSRSGTPVSPAVSQNPSTQSRSSTVRLPRLTRLGDQGTQVCPSWALSCQAHGTATPLEHVPPCR